MRGKKPKKNPIYPDQKYNNLVLSVLINKIMRDGKKTVATKIVYTALDAVEKKLKKDPMEVFNKALENLKPRIEVRSRRVGGANYQVPVPVPENRQNALAMRWLINASRDARKNKQIYSALADEIVSAYNGTGLAVKKKVDVEKMAEANKAFAHFQW